MSEQGADVCGLTATESLYLPSLLRLPCSGAFIIVSDNKAAESLTRRLAAGLGALLAVCVATARARRPSFENLSAAPGDSGVRAATLWKIVRNCRLVSASRSGLHEVSLAYYRRWR